MATSGSQLTRIGTGPAVGIKITILAKAASGVVETVLDFGRGFARAMARGAAR